MDYTSTLEILESFWLALSKCSEQQSEHRRSSTASLRLVVLGIAYGSQQGALFTLSQLLSITYRWITRVM